MIVLDSAGRHAYTVADKEAMIRLALTAPYTPWLTVFHVGARCVGGRAIAWFPCALLVSAVHRSRRVAMEYRSWLPGTTPNFARKDARRRFDELIQQAETGVDLAEQRGNLRHRTVFAWQPSGLGPSQRHRHHGRSVYFPRNATVPDLEAARTLRVYFRTGQRSHHITWTTSTHHTATAEFEPLPHPDAVGTHRLDRTVK
jgi:hypothetical protein